MNPILSKPERGWLIGGVAALGILMGILPLRRAGALPEEAPWFGAWGVLVVFAAVQVWPVARFLPIGRTPLGRLLFATGALAALFAACALGVAWLTALGLSGWLPSVEPAIRGGAWLPMSLGAAAVCLCILFLMYALDAYDQGEASARRALESEVASRDAELRALRAQVDPHFLFNCLHSISAMTSREPATARRMCLELADFFRASVRAGAEQRIPLADELQLVRGYLGIEQVRFGERLRVQVDEAGESAGVMVPPLLLQPLAENAVRHGIATLVEGGDVRVAVRTAGDRVEIAVRNPFDPDGRRPGTGVGLANVRGRLESAYRGGGMIRVDTSSEATPIFTVTLSIPAQGTSESRGAERGDGALASDEARRGAGVPAGE